jgi:hypothetical protein
MQIFMKTMTGKPSPWTLRQATPSANVKAGIPDQDGVPPNHLRLISDGRQLVDLYAARLQHPEGAHLAPGSEVAWRYADRQEDPHGRAITSDI